MKMVKVLLIISIKNYNKIKMKLKEQKMNNIKKPDSEYLRWNNKHL